MTRQRAVVIGCGAIAKEHLAALDAGSEVDVVAVCDRSPAAARYYGERYRASWFTDLDELLATVEADVAHVLTPPMTHVDLATKALAAGLHVIVEKPIAPSRAEFELLLQVARSAGRSIMESQNYRFNDPMLAIGRLLDSGRLGDPVEVTVAIALPIADRGSRFADPNMPSPVAGLAGGAVHDFLPHMTYLALAPLGFPAEPDRAGARWRNLSGIDRLGFDDLAGWAEYGNVRVSLRFSARRKPDRFAVTVEGTTGTVAVDLFNPSVVTHVPRGAQKLDGVVDQIVNGVQLLGAGPLNLKNKVMQHSPYHGLAVMLDRTYTALNDGTPLPVTESEMRSSLALADALLADSCSDRS